MPTDLTQLGVAAIIVLMILKEVFSFIKAMFQRHIKDVEIEPPDMQASMREHDAWERANREAEHRDFDHLSQMMEGWFKQMLEALNRIENKLDRR